MQNKAWELLNIDKNFYSVLVGCRLEKWLTHQFSIYGLNLKYTFIIRSGENNRSQAEQVCES